MAETYGLPFSSSSSFHDETLLLLGHANHHLVDIPIGNTSVYTIVVSVPSLELNYGLFMRQFPQLPCHVSSKVCSHKGEREEIGVCEVGLCEGIVQAYGIFPIFQNTVHRIRNMTSEPGLSLAFSK